MVLYKIILLNIISITLASKVGKNDFVKHEIVPDVLYSPPKEILKVTFPNGIEAQLGNELTPSQVVGVPTLQWNYDPNRFYTVVFCDADAPSRANPTARSFLHWLVVNIPGGDVTSGHTLTGILNSHPEPGTGLHRYVFLVYEQFGMVAFEERPDDSFERRVGFSPEEFSERYHFGPPVAGNFYQTENLED